MLNPATTQPHSSAGLGAPPLRAPELDGLGVDLQRERLLSSMFGIRPTAPTISHYALLGELGRGGMGIVYEAYDRTLDRRVAIKLLDARQRGSEATRLGREAQGLAKLSHPNVVQVHEIGEHEGAQYLVMEFVVGQTLRAWLGREADGRPTHALGERLGMLIQAGRGLAAAHAAGLVHRDFKPENVMVGDDGRARVLDFGLVRGIASLDSSDGASERLDTNESLEPGVTAPAKRAATVTTVTRDDLLRRSLTAAGTILGTPAYMAPEQLVGESCGPLADQFAFCVVAFELLHGRRPFAGRAFHQLSDAVLAGEIVELPRDVKVPARIHAAIVRGLAVEPGARWPGMDALLDELEHALQPRRRRRLGWLAGATLGGTVAAVGMWSTIEEPPPMCALDESALGGVWDDARREALRDAAAARTLPDAERTFAAIDAEVTSWTSGWLDAKRHSCEATHVVGTQSAAMLDLREACFERQRREAITIAAQLTSPAGVGLDHELELLAQLPDVRVCEDPRLAETSYPLPQAQRERILASYEQISDARTLTTMGRFDEADELVARLEPTVTALRHLPLSLELRFVAAEGLLGRHRFSAAVPRLEAMIRESEVAGLDELSATMRTTLARDTAMAWGRVEQRAGMLEEAETAVARVGRPDDRRADTLALTRTALQQVEGELELALDGYRASLQSARTRGDALLEWQTSQRLMVLLLAIGSFDEAERILVEARTSFEQKWGANPIHDARVELALGLLDLDRGRFDDASAHLARARERLDSSSDSDNRDLLELAEAKLAFHHGDLERAALTFARVAEDTMNEERRGEAWAGLGVIRFYRGDFPGSLDAYRRARLCYLDVFGPGHPRLGALSSDVGESLAASDDHQGALRAYAEALSILERRLPPDHPDLALPYKARAQSRIALGDSAGARLDLERSLALHEANPAEPVERADVEFTLARELIATGERARALELAAAAHHRLVELGHDERAAQIANWLTENP